MAESDNSALKLRLRALEVKRQARAGQNGYEENVAEIDEAIAQIKAEIEQRHPT